MNQMIGGNGSFPTRVVLGVYTGWLTAHRREYFACWDFLAGPPNPNLGPCPRPLIEAHILDLFPRLGKIPAFPTLEDGMTDTERVEIIDGWVDACETIIGADTLTLTPVDRTDRHSPASFS
jgi:hypothetical protein